MRAQTKNKASTTNDTNTTVGSSSLKNDRKECEENERTIAEHMNLKNLKLTAVEINIYSVVEI